MPWSRLKAGGRLEQLARAQDRADVEVAAGDAAFAGRDRLADTLLAAAVDVDCRLGRVLGFGGFIFLRGGHGIVLRNSRQRSEQGKRRGAAGEEAAERESVVHARRKSRARERE